jgi:anaerobic selenocysteine-containing dehydrogenase
MFNFVRLSDGGPARHVGPRSEVGIISQLADAVLGSDGPIDWQSMRRTSNIRQAISRVIPGWEPLADIDRSQQEFQIGGRTFHEARFSTPSGRANLHCHELPVLAGLGESELRLMTLRSEGQFNTVVYEDYDLYRGIDRRDVILLHPDDIARLKLTAGERVTVRSEVGEMPNILVTPFESIRPGNAAMYYPEANLLVPRTVDGDSKTPAFKCVIITVEVPARVPVGAT